jgi:hypothetical protein
VMKELSRQKIMIRIGDSAKTVEVGVVKLLEREGDGGKFRVAVLWENLETVLVEAATEYRIATVTFV